MASASSQSSPQKQDRERFDDRADSPILPFHRPGPPQPILPHPTQTTPVDNMEEAQKPNPRTQGNRGQVKTPEPRGSKERINGQKDMAERSPSTPGHLPSFDWDEF